VGRARGCMYTCASFSLSLPRGRRRCTHHIPPKFFQQTKNNQIGEAGMLGRESAPSSELLCIPPLLTAAQSRAASAATPSSRWACAAGTAAGCGRQREGGRVASVPDAATTEAKGAAILLSQKKKKPNKRAEHTQKQISHFALELSLPSLCKLETVLNARA
jgi:hypothetical protein